MLEPDEGEIPRLINRNRSKNFVEELASQLREEYTNHKSVFVLSKHSGKQDHREKFGLNELLFDILVCETEEVQSALGNETLTFVSKALWEIESEFARNSREAVYDFNKLVLGSSENKLFVGPQLPDEKGFLEPLAELAKRCNANIYVALVQHPGDWKKDEPSVHCWKFNGEWQPI